MSRSRSRSSYFFKFLLCWGSFSGKTKTMMHTTENTNIDIIKRNYEKLEDKTKDNNCVLIITGSFNPIHRSHINNIRLVKNYLENHNSRPMNVLAAYLSPTHDVYVHDKLGDRDWISAEERAKLCEEAIESENLVDLISVSRGEFQYDGFVDFDTVSENLAEFLNSTLCGPNKLLEYPLKVVYVCGLDHFNKCSYVVRLAKQKNMACAIIYRPGAIEDHIKAVQDRLSNIYYIALENDRKTLTDISSTAIRKRYQTSNNIDFDELSYPCVTTYYKKKFDNK